MKPLQKTHAQELAGQVEVLLPGALDHGFDYLAPEGVALREGELVSVPFGRGDAVGVVWQAGSARLAPDKLKRIARLLELPPFSPALLAFARWLAWYNCATPGAVLKMLLPAGDLEKAPRRDVKEHIMPAQRQDMALAQLSGRQQAAAEALKQALGKGFSVTLLDGVTGSGKTEVYFDAIAAALDRNERRGARDEKDILAPHASSLMPQILVLLPEIALTVQWLARFERRFGFAPLVWNSDITPARKRATWQAAARGEAPVVVGARSALFLPFANLQLVVVDEEHDASYKQEEGVIYHARDMAVSRARFENIPSVLVSATPSLESYYNARQGKYREITLRQRHGDAQLPSVEMLDMRHVPVERGAFVSNPLREALASTLAGGHQSMLFLNRRGYAPLMLCRRCGHRFQCPDCSSWLVLHKKGMRDEARGASNNFHPSSLVPHALLRCHHCSHRLPLPKACPECAYEELAACGPGVERLQEEVHAFLPQARVKVMASDHTDSTRELADTITAMERGDIDILIGTQMVAKGHHFAGLALVGVVDADLGLGGGDLRAAERTYQLLHQLSGRAGRERVAGKVYLQSYLPTHPVMRALLSGDRDAFLAAELDARREAHMPPFSRLAAVVIEGAKEDAVAAAARQLAASFSITPLPHHLITLLGPAPAPIYRLRGKYRWRLLLRAERNVNVPDFVSAWIKTVSPPSSVRLRVDIDPVSFL